MRELIGFDVTRCFRCWKPLEPWNGTVLGFGALVGQGWYCSPGCRDLNDRVWAEWHAPERRWRRLRTGSSRGL